MICCNEIPEVVNYGSSASYCCLPTPEQVANGVVPLDSLPAAWWNAMWAETNRAVNCARGAVGSLITELNTVLTQAGVCACATCTDQLYQSINKIRQRIADSTTPGAVKSSSTCGQVSVNANGIMTANGLGNTACLNTTSKEATGAINELKSTYDTCWSNNTTALGGKAPTAHASSATTYGVGTSANYGHLKISDTYTSVLSACSGVAASQKAANCIYAIANAKAAVGDTAGCALGTAAAGSATTAARSDHVHPKPTQVDCSCKSYLTSFTASADRPIMVTCPSCCNYQIVGYSTACPFTFNPATGEVKAKTFCGDLTGCAADSNKFAGCTYAQAKANILTGCAADSNKFAGCTYACAKADILSGNAASATNATCFAGCTYAQAKADIRNYTPASATNATCFAGCTYAQAKADILTGCAADSTKLGGTAAACYLLKTGCAADSAKLGNKAAACYALKTDCAPDSAKLGGTAAACYALKTDCAPDSAKLGGTAAACYALKTDCVACAGANGSGTAFGTAAVCAADSFAPKAHASTATTYGAGDASNYGHVKLSDTYSSSSNGTAACSVGASQCAVYAAYTQARCLGNATCYSKLTATAEAEAGAADCTITLGLARSFRWCNCPTNICSYDRRTYTKIGTYQCQNACAGYSYLDTCAWQCCYSGTAGVTTCTNRRFCFHSNGMFYAPVGLSGGTTCTTNIIHRDTGASKVSNINFCVSCTNASCTVTNFAACICGANGRYYGLGAVFSHASYGCALEIIRNAASGGAAICFKRQTTGLGSIAFTAADTLVRYKTDASACYQILDCSMTGSAVGNVAVVGAALGTTADKIVLTTAEGKLKPSANAVGSAAYCAVGTAVNAVPKIGAALSANNGYLVATDASGNLKNIAGINVYCGTTCKCCVNGATALCLCANAFNANAAISTTTYPGACCTGTVTVADKASSTDCTPIALCTGAKTVGKSTGCALTFDTCNGILRANCFAGVARRTACVPMFTNHYPEASAMYNRPIVPYLATPTSMDICCQCTCQSVTTFKIPTPFSCTYVQSCTDYDFDIKVYCYYGAVIKVQSTYTAGVCHTVCIGTAGLRTGDSYKVFMRIMNPEVTCGSCKRTCDYSGTGCTTVWHCLGRIKCNNTLCINVSYYEYDGFSINQCDPYNRPVQPVLAYADCYADGQSYIPPINI